MSDNKCPAPMESERGNQDRIPDVATESTTKCPYELKREDRMRLNAVMMQSLGFGSSLDSKVPLPRPLPILEK